MLREKHAKPNQAKTFKDFVFCLNSYRVTDNLIQLHPDVFFSSYSAASVAVASVAVVLHPDAKANIR